MRLVFMGCVAYSHTLLSRVFELEDVEVVGVATLEQSRLHADFCSLAPLARDKAVPCFAARGNDQESFARWLAERAPDVVYCFGWPFLLKAAVLSIPRLGVVGFHPTPLPRNRGRHPIVWTLALGLNETASTFFFMDEGADSGDLLIQEPVAIFPSDDAGALYARLVGVARRQIEVFTPQLVSGRYPRRPQDHSLATTWRKRTQADGIIDWRMSATGVHNLVRALARPYVGAHCVHKEQIVKVWRTRIADAGIAPRDAEPGRVLGKEGSLLLVMCGEGAVQLVEHDLAPLPEVASYM